jgi:hypothetical protein
MNLSSFRMRSLLVALVLAVAGCGGGSGDIVGQPGDNATPSTPSTPPTPPAPPLVSNELVKQSFTAAQGTTITVPANASGLGGATIVIPPDAATEDITLHVGYENAAPGPFSADAVAAQVTQVSRTILLKVADNGPDTFNQPVTVTMPYDVAAAGGLPPTVLYWDEDALAYQPVSVIAFDEVKGTVTFRTSHFSKFVTIVLKALSKAIPTVDTGFRLGADSVLHQNFGSYQFGGHCAAFASLSTYYYGLKKTNKLYSFAQEGADEQPADDEITRTALSLTYALIARKWSTVAGSIVIPSSGATGLLMIQAMLATGKPVHLVMHSNNNRDGGHSVTAFAYDATLGAFRIYDSNFPKNEVTFPWTLAGFGTYSRAASYPAAMFDFIGFAADDTFGAPGQFRRIVSDWESGKLKDFYANLQVTDEKSVVRPLLFEAPVTVQIPYQDNQTVTGKFNRPAGSSNPVFLHIYHDGVAQSATGVPLPAGGDFTLTFPTKLENKVEVMMLVSEHARDAFRGFSGFGKVTVQPEGKNFFVNFGFETGDMTAWNGFTSLLPQGGGGVFTPTKLTVVNVGFDPIATDIPTVQFGQHAVQVNDQDNSYHTTFIAQTATVPATGNPQLNFKWMAVLEDPQHSPEDQPFVEVIVRNVTKNTELYKRRFFANDPAFTGWKSYQGGQWKAIDWQSVVLTGLSQSAGDQIELKIVGADCGLGGHGGYVYLDGEE